MLEIFAISERAQHIEEAKTVAVQKSPLIQYDNSPKHPSAASAAAISFWYVFFSSHPYLIAISLEKTKNQFPTKATIPRIPILINRDESKKLSTNELEVILKSSNEQINVAEANERLKNSTNKLNKDPKTFCITVPKYSCKDYNLGKSFKKVKICYI